MLKNVDSFRRSKFKPQKGFGGNPVDKESWWRMTKEQVEEFDILFKKFDKELISKTFDDFYKIASWRKQKNSFFITFA